MGPALEWVDIYPVTFHWRKPISFCQQASITDNFLVRDGSPYLLPCLSAGTSSDLNLCWSWVISYVHKSSHVGRQCFLRSHHLCLLQYFCLFFLIDRWALRSWGVCDKDISCRMSIEPWGDGGVIKMSHLGRVFRSLSPTFSCGPLC